LETAHSFFLDKIKAKFPWYKCVHLLMGMSLVVDCSAVSHSGSNLDLSVLRQGAPDPTEDVDRAHDCTVILLNFINSFHISLMAVLQTIDSMASQGWDAILDLSNPANGTDPRPFEDNMSDHTADSHLGTPGLNCVAYDKPSEISSKSSHVPSNQSGMCKRKQDAMDKAMEITLAD